MAEIAAELNPYLGIVGIVALAPVMTVVFLLQRHIARGLTMGAVKG